jgi:SAM-dependent methyltransferase
VTAEAATIAFYDENAEAYAATTVGLDMSEDHDRFLSRLPPSGLILDAGSGSGRDTLAFIHKGFRVEAFDASSGLCRVSAELTGQPTAHMSFADVAWTDRFDGVWASASLLHLASDELMDAWGRLVRALARGGSIYASFKMGAGVGVGRDGRIFHLIDEPSLDALLLAQALEDADIRTSASVSGAGDAWLSVVATRRA